MAFEKPLPEWLAPGIEPPLSKRIEGWKQGDRPPAEWWNWFKHLTYEALLELQQKAAEKTEVQLAQQTADAAQTTADNALATANSHAPRHAAGGPDEITPVMIGAASQGDFAAHLNEKMQDGVHGLSTTANITYFVNASTGSDSNNGLSSGTAFKTIGKAISILPKIINHIVIIQLADGTYNEIVLIQGFIGGGGITLQGNSTTPTNVKINQVIIRNNACNIDLLNCEATATTEIGISINDNGLPIRITNVTVQTASTSDGILVSFSEARIGNCIISNRNRAIVGFNISRIHSFSNSGSGNQIGLDAREGSVIAKNGTQPGGTTAEQTVTGGVIR